MITTTKLEKITVSMNQLNTEIQKENRNEEEINNYLHYKKEFSNKIRDIKVEPINIKATFASYSSLSKLNKILDSTYSQDGFFFLSEFSLEQNHKNGENSIEFVLRGKKAILFFGD